MKKIYLSVVFIIIIFSLSGCKTAESGFIPVTSDISFDAQINNGTESYSYTASADEKGNIFFKAILPDEIKDFCCFIANEKCEISFGGVTSAIERDNTGALGAVYDIFEFARKNSNNAKADNDMYTLSGKLDSGKFKVIFTQSGIPISAELSNGTEIYFKNIKLLAD